MDFKAKYYLSVLIGFMSFLKLVTNNAFLGYILMLVAFVVYPIRK